MTGAPKKTTILFLDDLCKRWRMPPDQILEAAIQQQLPLWIDFSDVYLTSEGPSPGGKAKKKQGPVKTFQQQVSVRPGPEVLAMAQYRCDRMLVVAELACLDKHNQRVLVSNSVGEEWGETSMIGLKPDKLYAHGDAVVRYEQATGIVPLSASAKKPTTEPMPAEQPPAFNRPEHPHHAEELHIAVLCWQALYAGHPATAARHRKETVLQWLAEHCPHLSKAATARIAMIITPGSLSN